MTVRRDEFPPPFNYEAASPLVQRILDHPRVTFEADESRVALVLALKDELLVHPSVDSSVLDPIATHSGCLTGGMLEGSKSSVLPEHDVQVWLLREDALTDGRDSIHWARELTREHGTVGTTWPGGETVELPKFSPHHISVVSGSTPSGTPDHWAACPYDEPGSIDPPPSLRGGDPWLPPFDPDDPENVRVVVIDTGFIEGNPLLDGRGGITPETGQWLDEDGDWVDARADTQDADGDGVLDDIAGHGTFVTGLIAKYCSDAQITVVGNRHEVVKVPEGREEDPAERALDDARLFTSEVSIAAALANHLDADVVNVGFAFPALDGHPSLAIWSALAGASPHRPAIVSPVGNEDTSAEYWPAAHPRVIGVAASTDDGESAEKADFSNWGDWVDCCADGKGVVSTYVIWPDDGSKFNGWAEWSGTCFAAPKVTGAIACLVAEERDLCPVEAGERLLAGQTQWGVRPLTSHALWDNPAPAVDVTKPLIELG